MAASASGRWRQGARWAGHLLAALLVVAGVVAQFARPLAPDLGPPPPASAWFSEAYLARAAAYREPLYAVLLVALLIRILVPVLVALTPAGRALIHRIVARVGEHRPVRAATAAVLAVVVATDLLVLPLAFWAGFVHEGDWGFRTQGLGGWTYDWFVANLPVWIGVAVLVAGGYALARRFPRGWAPLAALGATVATAAVVLLAPLVLEPLSYRLTPLEPGPLRAEVERVVARSGERVERIVVADASRRSTKANAYVSGFGGTRRIVLYDTLIERQPPREVGVVLAHELGHHRNGDHWRGVLFSGAGAVVLVYALWGLATWRSRRGRQRGVTDPNAAAVVLAAVVALTVLSIPVQTLVSRRAEAAADLAALRITDDPEAYLDMNLGLARNNLANPRAPRWATLLLGTHPPTLARLGMGSWYAERQP